MKQDTIDHPPGEMEVTCHIFPNDRDVSDIGMTGNIAGNLPCRTKNRGYRAAEPAITKHRCQLIRPHL